MEIKNITYDSFFINLKELPPKGSEERKKLRERERERCLGGVYVDGVFMSGWLYWHTNFWWLIGDEKDEYGNIIPFEGVATLRDNEWLRAEALEKCRLHPDGLKGYIEVGTRQGGKSSLETSFCAYNATLFKKSQNIVVSGSSDDLGILKLRLDYGLNKIWDGLKKPKLTRDKRSKEVMLGYKSADNEDIIWSHIIVRNIAEGQNTEGPAGVTAKSFIMDEIGKSPFSSALEAAKPAFMSPFGWRAIPILCGTGGAFEAGEDAERIFYYPEANNFLGFTNEETGEVTGFFMPGTFRTDCKYWTNLADYLISEGKIPQAYYPELSKIPIKVSDKVKALEKIKNDRALKALDPDKTEYLKNIMYFPLTPKECFMRETENFFNSNIAREQKERLEEQYPGLRIGMYVELEETLVEGKMTIIHKLAPAHKLPISSFPCKPNENRDAPIVILEHPIPNPPYGLYVGGADPYKHEKLTSNSDSNGALVIFKRAYDALSDKFQDMPVAWLVARPEDKTTWNKNAELLIRYYNAITLCENDELGFIEYMVGKGFGHMMHDTPEWLREIAPTSNTLIRPKGMSSANEKIKEMAMGNLKQFCEEVFNSVEVLGETEKRQIRGVVKILDPMLLEEMIKWNKDGNFDRIIAYSFAITLARKMDALRINPMVQEEQEAPRKPKQQKSMFKPLGKTYQYRDSRTQLQRLLK